MGRANWQPQAPPTLYANGTNMQIVFGNSAKVARNRKITSGLFRLNAMPMTSGEKYSETASDPLHRKGRDIIALSRQQASIYGRDRAHIRPAAPAQVSWKNAYTLSAKTKRPIGPYDQQIQKSVLQRISSGLSSLNGGN